MNQRVLVSVLLPFVVGGVAGSAAAQEPVPAIAAPSAVGSSLADDAESLTAEEIVARNVAARGGLEAWRAVHAIRMSGLMDVGQGLQVPYTLHLQRPRKMRLDFLFDGEMVAQAYDGSVGWKRPPHRGRYELMTPEELEAAAGQAELDGPLIDYEAKGHEVELVGREKVEGRDAFELTVTLSTGAARHLYLDAETFLEVKVDGHRTLRGQDRRMETFFRDYRRVGGLLVPHVVETRVEGVPTSQKIVIDGVELNPDLADRLFSPPAS
jgi:hypothetical protein